MRRGVALECSYLDTGRPRRTDRRRWWVFGTYREIVQHIPSEHAVKLAGFRLVEAGLEQKPSVESNCPLANERQRFISCRV